MKRAISLYLLLVLMFLGGQVTAQGQNSERSPSFFDQFARWLHGSYDPVTLVGWLSQPDECNPEPDDSQAYVSQFGISGRYGLVAATTDCRQPEGKSAPPCPFFPVGRDDKLFFFSDTLQSGTSQRWQKVRVLEGVYRGWEGWVKADYWDERARAAHRLAQEEPSPRDMAKDTPTITYHTVAPPVWLYGSPSHDGDVWFVDRFARQDDPDFRSGMWMMGASNTTGRVLPKGRAQWINGGFWCEVKMPDEGVDGWLPIGSMVGRFEEHRHVVHLYVMRRRFDMPGSIPMGGSFAHSALLLRTKSKDGVVGYVNLEYMDDGRAHLTEDRPVLLKTYSGRRYLDIRMKGTDAEGGTNDFDWRCQLFGTKIESKWTPEQLRSKMEKLMPYGYSVLAGEHCHTAQERLRRAIGVFALEEDDILDLPAPTYLPTPTPATATKPDDAADASVAVPSPVPAPVPAPTPND